MSGNVGALVSSLQQFDELLRKVRRSIQGQQSGTRAASQQTEELEREFRQLNELKKAIAQAFELKYARSESYRLQVLTKNFKKQIDVYNDLLHYSSTSAEIKSLRQSISVQRRHQQQEREDEEESQQPEQYGIELQPVHQETLHFQRMIQLKEKQLDDIRIKMERALEAEKGMKSLIMKQGETINAADNNIDTARSNVVEGAQLLEEAKVNHKQASKKKWCYIGIAVVILAVILIPILVKLT